MLQEQLGHNLNSVEIVPHRHRSPRNGPNGVECEKDDRENGTLIGSENDWRRNASDSDIQIDDFDDGCVIETVETDLSYDTNAIDNGGPSDANAYEIENYTIANQSTSDEQKFNDRYGFFHFRLKK